jgi:hypothetical protein
MQPRLHNSYTADPLRYGGSAKFLDLSKQAFKLNVVHPPLTMLWPEKLSYEVDAEARNAGPARADRNGS